MKVLFLAMLASCSLPYHKCEKSELVKFSDGDGIQQTRNECTRYSDEQFIKYDGLEYRLVRVK